MVLEWILFRVIKGEILYKKTQTNIDKHHYLEAPYNVTKSKTGFSENVYCILFLHIIIETWFLNAKKRFQLLIQDRATHYIFWI